MAPAHGPARGSWHAPRQSALGTTSADFPLVGAIQNEFDVNGNAFVAKLSATGSALHYSTYLGGNGRDIGFGIAVDVDGNAYVTGAASGGFPLVDPLRVSFGEDAFVTKVNPAGSALVYSTYLGGSSVDTGFAIAVDWEGNVYVTGSTLSDDFPVIGGVQAQHNGAGGDVFVSKLDRTGNALIYSTYLGGSSGDGASAIAVDGESNAAGPLLGGCLESLQHLRGTPYWPDCTGAIFFIETSEEHPLPAVVDGILMDYANMGVLDRMFAGYARVSTGERNLDLQADALKQAGCEKICSAPRFPLQETGGTTVHMIRRSHRRSTNRLAAQPDR